MGNVKIFLIFFLIVYFQVCFASDRPSLIISQSEAKTIQKSLGKYLLLNKSFDLVKSNIDAAIEKGIEVPQPGEAGGYEHERHKQNYRDMQAAGLLFTITEDEKYAQFIKEMLFKYAEMYPSLGPHPLAHHQAPGKLFHQMLNETVWLLHTSQAYDCIYNWLSEKDREYIEKNIFHLITKWFTEKNAHEFDRIHNHGTWTVASVGMIGYVLKDQHLVDIALYGTKKNGEGGFLKQLDLLFSPDGYYMEGPYYIRYALRPFFYFAEAIQRNQPDLKIFDYRDQILKKAYYAAVQTAFPNGVLPPINDASRTMNISAPGVLIATNFAYFRYGSDPNILGIAGIQKQVFLNAAGLKIAEDYASYKEKPGMNWASVEFSDGFDGQQGGLGILRNGQAHDQSMLLMKYGVHGGGHGHFDKLHFLFFHHGRQVIPDYGFARWINIEPKFGGRYLPENKSYALTTVAHNTVVVDQMSQNSGDRKQAEKVWGERHFFDTSDPKIQMMSAQANQHYSDIQMQRTMFLIEDNRLDHPVIVDLYRLQSEEEHLYDYPLHFQGYLINTNFEYQPFLDKLQPLGEQNGYQHIWKTAEGNSDSCLSITWLTGDCYYSWITAATPGSKILFGQVGANDPNFNLRSEPVVIYRANGSNYLFASVIEPHGYFNEAQEKSVNARGFIQNVIVVGHNNVGSVIEVSGKNDLKWRIMVTNESASSEKQRSVKFEDKEYKWIGNFKVDLNAK